VATIFKLERLIVMLSVHCLHALNTTIHSLVIIFYFLSMWKLLKLLHFSQKLPRRPWKLLHIRSLEELDSWRPSEPIRRRWYASYEHSV